MSARSRSASALMLAPPPALAGTFCSASCQRSRKRCCWRLTTAGTSGAAWIASSRRWLMRSVRMATSLAPSRSRASRKPAMASRAAASAASSSRSALPPSRHHCSASLTLNTRACGSQPVTVDSSLESRLSWSGWGWGQALSESRWLATRTSILPRRKLAPTNSRKAGSRPRISSGRRKLKSRNRLFTERASTVTPDPEAAGREGMSSAALPKVWVASAKPVML